VLLKIAAAVQGEANTAMTNQLRNDRDEQIRELERYMNPPKPEEG